MRVSSSLAVNGDVFSYEAALSHLVISEFGSLPNYDDGSIFPFYFKM